MPPKTTVERREMCGRHEGEIASLQRNHESFSAELRELFTLQREATRSLNQVAAQQLVNQEVIDRLSQTAEQSKSDIRLLMDRQNRLDGAASNRDSVKNILFTCGGWGIAIVSIVVNFLKH